MTADLQSAPVLLEAKNVVKEFPIRGASREHRAQAVTDVSFEIRRGRPLGWSEKPAVGSPLWPAA